MPLVYEHQAEPVPSLPSEYELVCRVNGVDPNVPPQEDMAPWLNLHTEIVAQFSCPGPDGQAQQMISPSRAASVPAITARWQELVRPARGTLTPDEILYAWRTNMPTQTGERHPNALFDITQMNFGTDEPIFHIEYGITRAQRERRAMALQQRRAMHALLAPLRYNGDVPESLVDSLIESMYD